MPDASSAHQFDFWVGNWDVFDPAGNPLGTNSVTHVFVTGAIAEHWEGAGGVEGRSLNAYDRMRDCWHQTWVDSTGAVLLLDGGIEAGAMVLRGTARNEADPSQIEHQRITWAASADGSAVRQLWEQSADGMTWTVAFDGRYRRRA